MRLVVQKIRKEFKVDGEVLIIHGVRDARYIRLKRSAGPLPIVACFALCQPCG